YLFAEPKLIAQWRARLETVRGFRIGINWHGRVGCRESRQRDIPLGCFAPLVQLPDVRLISLQKGAQRQEIAAAGLPLVDFGDAVDAGGDAFVDTAAILMNLDLVITSDTSIPHVGGALGAPVWLA